jgi:uncharacterized protein YkwD
VRIVPAAPSKADEPAAEADCAEVARLLVDLTNAFRRQEGRRELASNDALSKAATDFAAFMAEADKYGHTADGRKPAERIVAAGYEYCLVDENIAWLFQTKGFTSEQLARQLFESWQNSPEHRRNLLNPHLGELGIAVGHSTKTGRYYGVQEFGRPKSEQIEFEVSNALTTALEYRIDGEKFALEPRHGRRHKRPVPPVLEIAGHEQPEGRKARLQPASGERFVARAGADGRIAVELIRPKRTQPAAE